VVEKEKVEPARFVCRGTPICSSLGPLPPPWTDFPFFLVVGSAVGAPFFPFQLSHFYRMRRNVFVYYSLVRLSVCEVLLAPPFPPIPPPDRVFELLEDPSCPTGFFLLTCFFFFFFSESALPIAPFSQFRPPTSSSFLLFLLGGSLLERPASVHVFSLSKNLYCGGTFLSVFPAFFLHTFLSPTGRTLIFFFFSPPPPRLNIGPPHLLPPE